MMDHNEAGPGPITQPVSSQPKPKPGGAGIIFNGDTPPGGPTLAGFARGIVYLLANGVLTLAAHYGFHWSADQVVIGVTVLNMGLRFIEGCLDSWAQQKGQLN